MHITAARKRRVGRPADDRSRLSRRIVSCRSPHWRVGRKKTQEAYVEFPRISSTENLLQGEQPVFHGGGNAKEISEPERSLATEAVLHQLLPRRRSSSPPSVSSKGKSQASDAGGRGLAKSWRSKGWKGLRNFSVRGSQRKEEATCKKTQARRRVRAEVGRRRRQRGRHHLREGGHSGSPIGEKEAGSSGRVNDDSDNSSN